MAPEKATSKARSLLNLPTAVINGKPLVSVRQVACTMRGAELVNHCMMSRLSGFQEEDLDDCLLL